jgi:hypothetical protein
LGRTGSRICHERGEGADCGRSSGLGAGSSSAHQGGSGAGGWPVCVPRLSHKMTLSPFPYEDLHFQPASNDCAASARGFPGTSSRGLPGLAFRLCPDCRNPRAAQTGFQQSSNSEKSQNDMRKEPFASAPEPGKAFHRVPGFGPNESDPVERVLTRFSRTRRVELSGDSLLNAPISTPPPSKLIEPGNCMRINQRSTALSATNL